MKLDPIRAKGRTLCDRAVMEKLELRQTSFRCCTCDRKFLVKRFWYMVWSQPGLQGESEEEDQDRKATRVCGK